MTRLLLRLPDDREGKSHVHVDDEEINGSYQEVLQDEVGDGAV